MTCQRMQRRRRCSHATKDEIRVNLADLLCIVPGEQCPVSPDCRRRYGLGLVRCPVRLSRTARLSLRFLRETDSTLSRDVIRDDFSPENDALLFQQGEHDVAVGLLPNDPAAHHDCGVFQPPRGLLLLLLSWVARELSREGYNRLDEQSCRLVYGSDGQRVGRCRRECLENRS